LDDATALPLRTEVLDEAGVPLVQTLFVDLRVGAEVRSVPTRAPRRSPPSVGHPSGRLRSPAGSMPWAFADLPRGFRLAMAAQRALPGHGRELHHLVFSDGVASVSIYIGAPGDHDLEGEAAVAP